MTHCTLTTLVIFVAIWNLSQGRVEHDNWGQETRDFREEQGGEKEENTNEDGLDLVSKVLFTQSDCNFEIMVKGRAWFNSGIMV